MHKLLQPGSNAPQQPLALRMLAIFCILLVAVMSTVQVCHTHDLLPRTTRSHSGIPGPNQGPDSSPDHCPLCVAMHSAMPTELQSAPEPVLHMQRLDSVAADAERIFRWRFQLASRPPPADSVRS